MMTVPEWMGLGVLSVLCAIIWWGAQRLIEGQEKQARDLGSIMVSVARICGNVEKATAVQEQHKSVCDERYDLNMHEHREIKALVAELRP